jgi:hypothetical protein
MSSESVCHFARSWVDVGSFHTRLFFYDLCSVSPEYFGLTLAYGIRHVIRKYGPRAELLTSALLKIQIFWNVPNGPHFFDVSTHPVNYP